MGKLDGKIALITGGSDGMGLATAQQFIAEGADHVFITGRRQQALDGAIQQLNSTNVTALQGDACNMADLDKWVHFIRREKGRLDILFANAGIGESLGLGSITEKHFDDLININMKAVLFTVQKVLPIIVDGGSIILNGSVGSIKGIPGESVYCATKAAVRSFARCWSSELKGRRIRVNTLSPGPIDTPGLRHVAKNEEEEEGLIKFVTDATVLGRLGTPTEIAKAAVFLASDDSSYITGIELFVDGGWGQI